MLLRRFRYALPLALTVFFVDCTTKELAVEALVPEHTPHRVIGSAVRFTLAYNRGAAMGLPFGAMGRWPLVALSLVVVAVLLRFLYRTPLHAQRQRIALGLLLGGAFGNLLSRVRSPAGVVDFIDIGIGQTRFYLFNVADIAVCVGAVLLALVLWRETPRPPEDAAA